MKDLDPFISTTVYHNKKKRICVRPEQTNFYLLTSTEKRFERSLVSALGVKSDYIRNS